VRGAGALNTRAATGPPSAAELSRRTFLTRAGLASAATLAAQLPALVARDPRWLEAALAAGPDLVHDTFNGLVAFVVPGPDRYSVAQGHSSRTPGGIAAGATQATIDALDAFVGSPAGPGFPSSSAVTGGLNATALTVNPAATGGGFPSAFARLSFPEKIEVFNRFEANTEGTEFRYVSGVLIATVAFVAYSEVGALDPRTRRLTKKPVGWRTSGYDGVSDARHQLRGYWHGRKSVKTAKRYRRDT
jgi:hypothetical protein